MFGIQDPSALLRPWRNLQQFTEELYAMFKEPGETTASSTHGARRNPTPSETPERRRPDLESDLRVDATRKSRLEAARENSRLPDVIKKDSHASRPAPAPAPRGDTERQRSKPEVPSFDIPPINPQPEAGNSHDYSRRPDNVAPVVSPETQESSQPKSFGHYGQDFSGVNSDRSKYESRVDTVSPAPVKLSKPEGSSGFTWAAPEKPAKDSSAPKRPEFTKSPDWESKSLVPPFDFGPVANQVGGGGTTTLMGIVMSGSGDTYQVQTYSNGPKSAPDATAVTVWIPQIDPNETIPQGTWLNGIGDFTDDNGNTYYSCQPPVWLA